MARYCTSVKVFSLNQRLGKILQKIVMPSHITLSRVQ